MSEVFDLMGQANDVAETAKDAMKAKVLVADKTSQTLARTILKEAKTLVPDSFLNGSRELNYPNPSGRSDKHLRLRSGVPHTPVLRVRV